MISRLMVCLFVVGIVGGIVGFPGQLISAEGFLLRDDDTAAAGSRIAEEAPRQNAYRQIASKTRLAPVPDPSTNIGVAEVSSFDGCDYDCRGCEPCYPACSYSNACSGCGQFFVRGWFEQGITFNAVSPRDRFNGPLSYNDRSNEYQANQLYLSLGRAVDRQSGGWDVGMQLDLLYGTDYFFTTATGLETKWDPVLKQERPRWNSDHGPRGGGDEPLYGLSMPQLYAELFVPFGYGTTFKFGRFYKIMGHESAMAPENFFYSHSYVFQYGEPLTHTGMLASYRYSPQLTVHAGLTRGWDTWEDPNDKLAFLTGVSYTSTDRRTSLAFALHTGKEDVAGENNRTAYSLVLTRHLTHRLAYTFQHDFGVEANAAVDWRFEEVDAHWYGINQYLVYALSDTTGLGFRFEWFRDEDNARVIQLPFESTTNGGNYFAATVGLNWRPTDRIVLRPECRWDWSDVDAPSLGNRGMYNGFTDKSQFTFGTDLIICF